MKEKIKEVIGKLKTIEVKSATAYIFYNMYLSKKVYFRYGIITLTDKQEQELIKIYEPTILKKIRA